MKRSKKHTLSTDYIFEALYQKSKAFLFSNLPSKLAALKVLAIVTWFKDIN
ncbi:hypothetical protein DFQ10_101353 [Winogradskyella eximia]|uniref:Uncharacterized protein n=1 Tax=Winogradskyella eximia TaxID=262006 RepID=A0A3D9HAS4_9FLAO|nr:hypothetical protein [Winogradskyella eximia]RED46582.1 hypothetical protein DFQ10_101353 [Winogradskyella eximia]|tara:strand:+ start:239 stop:391 length:153 start_codon:yes stop_codon:yes gene_type:complete